MSSERPTIAITMGDAAGIGPEVVMKSLQSAEVFAICRAVVIGERTQLQKALQLTGVLAGSDNARAKFHVIHSMKDIADAPGVVDLLDLDNLPETEVAPGRLCEACGRASVEYITAASRLAINKEVDAIVTAPISKEALRLAGCADLGHMDFLARLTGTKEYATMLTSGQLRVVHLTTHHSLRDALAFIKRERVFARLKLTWQSLLSWGFTNPRIAVSALNPHGGEGGLLGQDEIRELAPAVAEARQAGINASGPFPADSVFTRAIKGEFDAVLALYHDQGHIPIKVHGFEKSVSVALGLPFIRTSVDHGTAFDIAGKGIASAQSMIEAIKVAVSLSRSSTLTGNPKC